jgi:Patatin-like phospholipase
MIASKSKTILKYLDEPVIDEVLDMSVKKTAPKVQRALVLQGGGALGAYEAGVLNILSKNLRMEDKENGEENRLLFDVIVGTSIGAMNGAILVILLSAYAVSFLFCGVALTVHAQSDLQTTKYRNMVIDLNNGLKTNARLNLSANGTTDQIFYFICSDWNII